MAQSTDATEPWRWLLTASSAVAGACFAVTLKPLALLLACVAAALAWCYSVPPLPGLRRLRDFGIVKILTLAGVWTVMTCVLPLAGEAAGSTIAFLACRRFLFMFALCLAFDIRDVEADADRGVQTVPVRLGTAWSYRLVRLSLGLFVLASVPALVGQPPLATVGIACALCVSAGLTWLTIEATRTRHSTLLYLGGVDGMMLLQCVLVMTFRAAAPV